MIKRNLFTYAGSKTKIIKRLIDQFPPHQKYVSMFGGTGCEFRYFLHSVAEIFNDIDQNVYSVFACLKNTAWHDELVRMLVNSPHSRRLYHECRERLEEPLSTLDRAYCFLIVGNLGFSGLHPLTQNCFSTGNNHKLKILSLPHALRQWRDRFRHVIIENLDWEELVESYDGQDTFFFCDPPYVPETLNSHTNLYLHTDFNHPRFLARMKEIKGRALICGYPTALYDRLLTGWRINKIATEKTIMGRADRIEWQWMNYDLGGVRSKRRHNDEENSIFTIAEANE